MADDLSTSAQLRQCQRNLEASQAEHTRDAIELTKTQQALAASQADLTSTRGRVVDLLYIIDAFQIESGADREAAYATGIEAVRQMRADLTRAEQERDTLREVAVSNKRHAASLTEALEAVERERDGVRAELDRLTGECEDLKLTLAMRTRQLREAGEQLAAIGGRAVEN